MERTVAPSADRALPPAGGLLPALGAVLAGGASSRFGSPKAVATVGGTPLVARVAAALAEVVTHPVVITHLPEVSTLVALPVRADVTAGAGPLAGVEAALVWAEELGLAGALCVACDLPFVPATLLRELASRGLEGGPAAVVPESPAPGEVEPLCAWYATSALPAVRDALRGAERSLGQMLQALGAERLALGSVAAHGDPAVLFLNVNTRDSHRAAEAIAAAPHG